MSTELEQLMLTLEDKTKATKTNYKSAYKKLRKVVEKDFAELSEDDLINGIKTSDNPNSQQATINVAILVYKSLDKSVEKLIKLREENKQKIKLLIKAKNGALCVSLPSYNQLIGHLDGLYEASKWQEYIICYLLININCRNKDLNIEFVSRKGDMLDKTRNYIWFNLLKKNITLVRNEYKTVGTYGQKVNLITNAFFFNAVKKYMAAIKHEPTNLLIPNESQIAYYIQKSTFDQIGSSNYMKICVNHFRDNLNKITEISENRGTDIQTILENYDVCSQ
tara:strand:+ start:1091 stop:1927 length:837 start_codon:yes stop_codon:yes gene_type:complete